MNEEVAHVGHAKREGSKMQGMELIFKSDVMDANAGL